MNTQKQTVVGVRLPDSLKKQLEQLAKLEGRPLSNYIRRILELHIEETSK